MSKAIEMIEKEVQTERRILETYEEVYGNYHNNTTVQRARWAAMARCLKIIKENN